MCTVPKPYPREFRDDVVNVARRLERGQTLRQIAADLGD
jgi:transposase